MHVHFKRREIPFMPPPLKAICSFPIIPIQNQKLALKPHGLQVCITVLCPALKISGIKIQFCEILVVE